MDGPPGKRPPTLTPASFAATPQFQQAFSALAQMYGSQGHPSHAEHRQTTCAPIQIPEGDQARTQAPPSSEHEASGPCSGPNDALHMTINTQAARIDNLETHVATLRADNAELMQRLGAMNHSISQFEGRITSAYNQLIEHINHQIDQQTAQIDTFQNRIVAPLFTTMQQVLAGETASSRLTDVLAAQPAVTRQDLAASTDPIGQESSNSVTNCDTTNTMTSHDAHRSTSIDSYTPLAKLSTARLNGLRAVRAAHQHSVTDNPVTTSTLPIIQRCSAVATRLADVNRMSPAGAQSDSLQRSATQEVASAPLLIPPSLPARFSAPATPIRILPLPSPSPSLSPNARHVTAHATPFEQQSSAVPLATTSKVNSSLPTGHDFVNKPRTDQLIFKRQRAPSFECVQRHMAKKHASDVHLEEASTVPHLESLGQPTRELEHAYIEHLASLTEQPPPGGHREPFHIWAWLGNADARPAPLNEKMPLLLAPDDSVSESLVAESVAATLIHNGFARIADTPTSSGWLELDLSWLLHMEDSEFGVRKRRFTDQGSRFLIVPTKFMKQGISLGKTSMQRLNMRLVREDPGTTPHLEMGEFQGWHARLKCLSKDSHRNYATKPFERLCRLAEESYLYLERRRVSESDIDRNERGRRGAPDCYRPSRDRRTSQIAGSTTPPREERHYGQSAELLGPISGSEHSRREFSRLGDRAIRGVASDQDTREVEHHSVAPFPRTRHADTPHPSTTSTEQEARHFREQWERERERSTDRSTAARGADTVDLDYGSPLTRTTLAQVGAYEDDDDYSDEVDELADA